MQKSESILKNEAHKLLQDFKIQTDCWLQETKHNISQQEEKTLSSSRFCRSSEPLSEN